MWIYYCNLERVWGRLRTYCFPIAQCRYSEINSDSIIPLQTSIEVYNKWVEPFIMRTHGRVCQDVPVLASFPGLKWRRRKDLVLEICASHNYYTDSNKLIHQGEGASDAFSVT